MSKSLDASPSTAPEEALIGRELAGRYRIESRVGAGGFGIVYRAWDLHGDAPVAVKVLREEFFGRHAQRGRFDREARALVHLSHPHIVSVTDYGVDGEMPFLVMELLEGHALDLELKKRGPLSIPRCFRLAQQLLDGLSYIHKRDLVHRDVKPANIFLHHTAEGTEQLKLLDFGLAKFLDLKPTDGAPLTRAGDVFGTPGYMPPEQLASEEVDRRADVYSAGVVLYEMLTGRRPFTGPPHEVLRMVLVDPPPPIRSLCPNRFPHADLESVLHQAMAKAPEDRFQNAADFAAALTRVPEPPIIDMAGKVMDADGSMPEHPAELDGHSCDDPPFSFSSLFSGRTPSFTRPRGRPTAAARSQARPTVGRRMTFTLLAGLSMVAGALGYLQQAPARTETRVAKIDVSPVSDAGPQQAPPQSPPHPDEPQFASAEDVKAAGTHRALGHDPLSAPLPRLLQTMRDRIRRNPRANGRTIARLRRYNREHKTDPRGHLLLARIFMQRNWPQDALAQYKAALHRDPACHGDTAMLSHLTKLATNQATARAAASLIREVYGEEAHAALKQSIGSSTTIAGHREVQSLEARVTRPHTR